MDQLRHGVQKQVVRRMIIGALSGLLVLPTSIAFGADFPTAKVNTTGLAVTDTEVTVGNLHSKTGTMAISETGSIQAETLAIEQINAMGGVLGRKIKEAFTGKIERVMSAIAFAEGGDLEDVEKILKKEE